MDPRPLSSSVRTLSDSELLGRIESLASRAHNVTLWLLLHFVELERRRLHLTMGYRSMFDYCRRRLKFSESAAGQRIRVARCVARFPDVFSLLFDRRLSMMAVSRISRLLTDKNKDSLLKSIEGKTYEELDAIIAGMQPGAPIRERIRPVCIDRTPTPTQENKQQELRPHPTSTTGKADVHTTPGSSRTANTQDNSSTVPAAIPAIERHFKFEFGITEPAMRKFSRAQALLTAKEHRSITTAEFFETLIDDWLKRNDPTVRAHRRQQKSRHIPAAIRDAVHLRDGGQCTFVGPDGIQCTAREGLELDHIKPFAMGGEHSAENLRLLCAAHNRLRAERSFGKRKRNCDIDDAVSQKRTE